MAVKNHAEDGDESEHNKNPRSLLMAFSCSAGSILWFDPRREHSSVPTAKSRSRRAQGLSRLAASSRPPEGLGLDWPEHGGMLDRIGAGGRPESALGWGVGVSHSADEVSCRMFLCARCRSQVLVCRRCDRGQIYCIGTCAQQARRDNQREARRRYQATPRGRAMHAARNRCYRARGRCVTDHGLANVPKAGPLLGSEVDGALSEPSSSRKSPGQWLCHHCRRSASAFARLSALRPGRHRCKKGQISHRGPLLSRPP
jgi:hypothetical protein